MINASLHGAPQPLAKGGITELVLTQNAPDQTQLLLPMVAHLSRSCQDRWLTWISPGPVDRGLLERYGVDTTRIRLIHINDQHDARWIVWEALAKGNSHTVIAAPGKLTKREMHLLEGAAQRGECQGLMLRMR
ncbi:cell division inhibitor SulA [Marinimicrobium sp. ABcell2]|uniref:cell division inhibitor SulA n=1 Tax=Marinimicrobium sp. ABcell2 TaxID=3069751 RepID=UPI0027B426F6|nr:SulA-like leucine-rich domain-containing protein [Marinimicrobium sp. ABcell2]MDQ2075580.1 SulA-like leucine-rich domain-containing protein [Marinimicrobium sp. ABcell2]